MFGQDQTCRIESGPQGTIVRIPQAGGFVLACRPNRKSTVMLSVDAQTISIPASATSDAVRDAWIASGVPANMVKIVSKKGA